MDLVEREVELARLRDRLDQLALDGRGGGIVISGVPGIGKTSLLQTVATEAELLDVPVGWAAGREIERTLVLGVVESLLAPLVAGAVDELSDDAAVASAVELLGVRPCADGQAPQVDQGRAAVVVHRLVEELAAERPLVLLVDDLQWADALSVEVVVGMVERWDPEVAVLFVLGVREEPGSEELLMRLEDCGVERVRPGPLSAGAIRAVAAGQGRELDAAAVAALAERSHGVPFLVIELARGGTQSEAEHAVPMTVETSVQRRMAGLDAVATTMLQMLSVLGRADAELLAAATGLAAADVARGRAAAQRAQLLTADGAFEHALIRDAVYASIPGATRAVSHLHATRALLAAGAERAAAVQALSAAPQGDPAIVAVLRAEAERARRDGSPLDAVRLLERAVDEPPPPDELYAVLVELMRMQAAAARFREVPEIAERARALAGDDVSKLVEVAAVTASASPVIGEAETSMAELRALLRRPALDARQRLRVEALLATMATYVPGFGNWTPAELTDLDEATAVDSAQAWGTLVTRARYTYIEGGPRARVAELGRLACVRPPGTEGDPVVAYRLAEAIVTLAAAGEPDQAIAFATPEVETARAAGSLQATGFLLYARAYARFMVGDLRRCEEDLGEVDEGVTAAVPFFFHGNTSALLAHCLREQGRLDAADDLLRRSPDGEAPALRGRLSHPRGLLHLARNDDALALAALYEMRDMEARDATLAAPHRTWRPGAALALWRLERRAEALRVAEEHLAFAAWWDAPQTLGEARRVMARITDDPELLEKAIADLDESAAALELAKCLFDLGRMERRGGQRTAAAALLQRAVEVADRCGARGLAEAALGELTVLRSRPQTLAFSGLDALTASERRVARLAAQGLSTKQIAQMLYVSSRTVENHLSRVYRKLDIPGRDGLRGRLGEEAAA